MIERLRGESETNGLAGHIRTGVMDGQHLEVPKYSFDVAASIFGVLFFPDQNRPLREFHRVLAPGEATTFRQRMLEAGFSSAHIVELRHVWVFDTSTSSPE